MEVIQEQIQLNGICCNLALSPWWDSGAVNTHTSFVMVSAKDSFCCPIQSI